MNETESTGGVPAGGRGRIRLVRGLIALGAVLTFLAIFSVWVERQLLDTDDWVQTSAELIEEEEIREALAHFLIEELYANVDMEGELEEMLPEPVKGLAGPAAGGLRQGAGRAAEFLLETGTAKELWAGANRAAHSELVAILENREEYIDTDRGVITLDLGAMLRDFADQVGVGGDLVDEIPPDAAQVEVLQSDELATAQDATRAIKGLALLLSLLAIAAFAGSIALARGRRWIALLGTAIGIAAAAFLVLIVRQVAGSIVVDQAVTDQAVLPAAEATWSIGTALLSGLAVSLIVFAAALAVAAWLASPAESARRTRRLLAPGLRDHLAVLYGALGLVFGLYLLAGGVQSIRSLITALAVAALAAIGLRELRRMAVAEHPDAPPWPRPAELRRRAGEAVGQLRRRSGDDREDGDDGEGTGERTAVTDPTGPAAEPTGPVTEATRRPATPLSDPARLETLERLAALHERGVLTDEELAAEKARLLGE